MEVVCLSEAHTGKAEHVNTPCLFGTSVLWAGAPAALWPSAIDDSGRFHVAHRYLSDIHLASPLISTTTTVSER